MSWISPENEQTLGIRSELGRRLRMRKAELWRKVFQVINGQKKTDEWHSTSVGFWEN